MKILLGTIVVVAVSVAIWFATGRETANAPSPADDIAAKQFMQTFNIRSSAFTHNGMMPERFTCDGSDTVPPLEVGNIPAGTKTLALVMHDPDAPRAGGWTHWIRYNIKMENENSKMIIREGEEPTGVAGRGTGGELMYQGPCPPSGTHRYVFSVYALDTELALNEGATKTGLESAMEEHILATGELIGLYSRSRK